MSRLGRRFLLGPRIEDAGVRLRGSANVNGRGRLRWLAYRMVVGRRRKMRGGNRRGRKRGRGWGGQRRGR